MSTNLVPLGDVCSLITDGKHGDCHNEEDSGYYFISAKDVKEGAINYFDSRQITRVDFEETHRRTDLKPGDVLITNSGTIGRLAVVQEDERTPRTTFQKSVAVVKPKREILDSHYLYYTLEHSRDRLVNAAAGAAQKNLLLGDIRRFPINMPGKEQQQAVVDRLKPFDDLITNNRRRIELLEKSAHLLFREWFVQLRYPGHEHDKVVDGVPQGWYRKKLGDLFELRYGKALPEEKREPGLTRVYGSSGEVGMHSSKLVDGPGIVVGRKGNVGSVFWVDFEFWPIDTVYFVEPDKVSLFNLHLLQTMNFQNSDAAVPGLNREYAYSIRVLQPSRALSDEFEEFSKSVFSQRRCLLEQNTNLGRARDLLLPRIMDGRIAV